MNPHEVLRRLHAAQGAFYAGEPADELRAILTDDIVWTVPGDNAIAGVSIRMHPALRAASRPGPTASG